MLYKKDDVQLDRNDLKLGLDNYLTDNKVMKLYPLKKLDRAGMYHG